MKITICGSLNFAHEMNEVASQLEALGHEVFTPLGAEKITSGEFSLEKIKKEKQDGVFYKRTKKYNAIRTHYKKIQESDAVLVVNLKKNNTENYIGGSSFLEMGFAYVNNKKIYIFNNIPKIIYTDEIRAMEPILLKGEIKNIT